MVGFGLMTFYIIYDFLHDSSHWFGIVQNFTMPPSKWPWAFPSNALAWLKNHTTPPSLLSIINNTFKWRKCHSFFSVDMLSFFSEGTVVSFYFCLHFAHWLCSFAEGYLKKKFINDLDGNQVLSEMGSPHIWPQGNDLKFVSNWGKWIKGKIY